jgi:surface protein
MFYGVSSFNSDLAAWDVSKVSTMPAIFYDATLFDQDVSSWNTSSVQDMSGMLSSAPSFKYCIIIQAASLNKICVLGTIPTNAGVGDMFLHAKEMANPSIPVLSANPPGPLCYVCQ